MFSELPFFVAMSPIESYRIHYNQKLPLRNELCVQRCNLWVCAWRNKRKKKLSCMKMAICPDHPRQSTPTPTEILHAGYCPRGSYIFQVK